MFQNVFEENTFKHYYYQTLSDEDTNENPIIQKHALKRKLEEKEDNIDELFNDIVKSKKKKQCSWVSRKQSNGGTAYITTNQEDAETSSHMIKIEIYDLKKLTKIPPQNHWKHAEIRVKYYTNNANKNLDIIKNTIYNVTKEISSKDSCKKMFFNNSDK